MNDDFPESYSGIQDNRDSSSSLLDYRDEIKALGAGSVIASGMILPAEMAEDVYGPSDLYQDSAEVAQDLYFEGSERAHEGLEISFDVINSIL